MITTNKIYAFTFVVLFASLGAVEPGEVTPQTSIEGDKALQERVAHFKQLSQEEKNAFAADEAELGNASVVRSLIAAGANPDCVLISAAWHGRQNIVELALDKGAHVDATINGALTPEYFGFFTPLIYASLNGHTNVVKTLIEHHANAHCFWAISYAAGRGHAEIVKLLIDAKNPYLNDALIAAAASGKTDVVKLLLDAQADPSYWNEGINGSNALIDAAKEGHSEVVKLLLDTGKMHSCYIADALKWAHFNAQASADCPTENGNTEIINLLKAAGAQ
ncbi:MAG: ankyrin repeat domain-containing protein [Candidatus Babeliales bacterium]|jgi:ankyrin repeat protein